MLNLGVIIGYSNKRHYRRAPPIEMNENTLE